MRNAKLNSDALKKPKVVLFGAGNNGRAMLENLLACGITPAYFVDNNWKNIGSIAPERERERERDARLFSRGLAF